MSVTIFAIQKKYAEQTCPAQHLLSGKRDSKLVQARVGVTFYLHPQPLKGAMRVTANESLYLQQRGSLSTASC